MIQDQTNHISELCKYYYNCYSTLMIQDQINLISVLCNYNSNYYLL